MREKAISGAELVSKGRDTNENLDNCVTPATASMKYLQEIN